MKRIGRIGRIGRVARAGGTGVGMVPVSATLEPTDVLHQTANVIFNLSAAVGGSSGFTFQASGGPVTVTSVDTSLGFAQLSLSRTINSGEVLSTSYAPGNVTSDTGIPLTAFANLAVTNPF